MTYNWELIGNIVLALSLFELIKVIAAVIIRLLKGSK